MNEELNRKLAEWAGIKWKITERTYNRLEQDIWVSPDGTIEDEPPNFTQSLDACFKWLVPKLIQTYPIDAIGMEQGLWSIHLHNTSESEAKTFYDNGSNPPSSDAYSLCLAIEKLIDGGTQ